MNPYRYKLIVLHQLVKTAINWETQKVSEASQIVLITGSGWLRRDDNSATRTCD